MKWSNAVHNLINILIVVITGLEGFGWVDLVGPDLALQIVAGLAAVKLVINAIRDGLAGMMKVQPPVE